MEKKTILLKKIKSLLLLFILVNLLHGGNFFVKSEIKGGELKLYFESDIERVTYFEVPTEDGETKYVYDIHGGVLPKGKGISHHSFRNITSFRMGQNTPERLRVVIRSPQEALDQHIFYGNLLSIPLVHGKVSVLKALKEREALEDLGESETEVEERAPTEEEDTHQESKMDEGRSVVAPPPVPPTPTMVENEPKVLPKQPVLRQQGQHVVVIDAGHGGKDNGASCCDDRKEKEVVLAIANRLKERLESMDYIVYMTRDDDTFVRLPERTAFANEQKADIFVSIHANAAPNKTLAKVFQGLEIYYLSEAQTQRAKEAAEKENSVLLEETDFYSKNAYISLLNREKIIESHKLGLDVNRFILRNVRAHFGEVNDGGVKPANFWVLVGALMPAILVETGYITHPEEGKNLLNPYYQKLLAKGIAEGIERYLSNQR